MSQAVDRNLLLGLLAWQMNLIPREAFLAAMRVWVADKTRSLGEILLAQGALGEAERSLLEIAVEKQMNGRPAAADESLAALRDATTLHMDLQELADPDVRATLARSSPKRPTLVAETLPPTGEPAAEQAGRFRLLREVARGGLGKIHLALDEELRREVALKEIQSRFAEDQALRRRFVLEAEITGRLEHPGVVPVYGMGAYPDGRPYYAMRFIKGESLREAIENFHAADREPGRDPGERALSLRKLLGRFVGVCNAMEYAHSRGVLHRDLKPDNIMLGDFGETLVVDWGLAKPIDNGTPRAAGSEEPLDVPAAADAVQTQVGQAVGTPAYMSPEQGQGRHSALTPASDVYSLGATLYALLTGRPAFSSARADDVLALVQAGDFPAPRQMNPSVPPALAAVCVKAMARLPENRYASARELADEIEAWLADEPVRAWPEPWSARAGRWLRRHRSVVAGGTTAAAAVIVSLATLALVLTGYNQRLNFERDRAEENFKLARESVDRYLVQVSEDPRLRRQGLEPLRRELLETARKFYEELTKQQGSDPRLRGEQARAYFRLANITAEIGTQEQGAEYLVKAIDILHKLTAADPTNIDYQDLYVKAHNNLGLAQTRMGKFDEAAESYRVAIQRGEELVAAHGEEATYHSNLAATHAKLGMLYQSTTRPDLAESELQQAAAVFEQLVREIPHETWYRSELALARQNLGLIYLDSGRTPEAEEAFDMAIALLRDCVKDLPDDLDLQANLSLCLTNRGALYWKIGRLTEAEAMVRESIASREPLLKLHPDVTRNQSELALALGNLGMILNSTDRLGPAEESLLRSVELFTQVVEKNPQAHTTRDQLAKGLQNLAIVYGRLGLTDASRATQDELLALRERLASEHPQVTAYQFALAQVLMNKGLEETSAQQFGEADKSLARSLGIASELTRGQSPPLEHVELMGQLRQRIGALRLQTRRLGEAAESLAAALKIQELLARNHADRPQFRYQLSQTRLTRARLFETRQELDLAETEYHAAADLLDALVREFPTLAEYRGTLGVTRGGLAQMYLRDERSLEAESEITLLLDMYRELQGKNPKSTTLTNELAAAQHNLGLMYLSMQRPAEATASFQAAIDTRTPLIADHPEVPMYKFFWSQDQAMIGWLHFEAGRRAESRKHFDQARAALVDILRQGNASPEVRAMLGQVQHNRGLLFLRQDRLDEAAEAFREAAELRQAVSQSQPENVDFAVACAWSCQNLGLVLNRQKEHDQALAWLAKGKDLLESLSAGAQASLAVKEPLRATYATSGKVLGDLGRLAESLDQWNKALDFDPTSGVPELRLGRAETLFRLGKYADALAEARRVKGPLATNGEDLLSRIRAFLDCRTVVLKDEKLPDDERADFARQFDDLAIEYLEFAAKNDYQQDAIFIEQLKTDKAFDPLREKEEFKALVEAK